MKYKGECFTGGNMQGAFGIGTTQRSSMSGSFKASSGGNGISQLGVGHRRYIKKLKNINFLKKKAKLLWLQLVHMQVIDRFNGKW